MLVSFVCLTTLAASLVAIWTLLRTIEQTPTLVAIGTAIVCSIVSFSFAPWSVQMLIVITLLMLDKSRLSSGG
jgi:hypothetical protein